MQFMFRDTRVQHGTRNLLIIWKCTQCVCY